MTAQINVTPVFTFNNVSCFGNSQSYSYIINPTPIVNNPGDQFVCEGINTPNLVFGGTGNSYSWSSSNQSTGVPQNGYDNIASFFTQNGSTGPLTSIITVTPYFNSTNSSCPGSPQQFTYFVLPNPLVSTSNPNKWNRHFVFMVKQQYDHWISIERFK